MRAVVMALLRAGSLRATMLSIWCLLAYLAGSQADAVVERQSDSGMKQFHHRAYHNCMSIPAQCTSGEAQS